MEFNEGVSPVMGSVEDTSPIAQKTVKSGRNFSLRMRQGAQIIDNKNKAREVFPTQEDKATAESQARTAFLEYCVMRDKKSIEGEIFVDCKSSVEALARTRELMGVVDSADKKGIIGKFGEFRGKKIGFSAQVAGAHGYEERSFRYDYSPENGSHINALVRPRGMGKNSKDALNIAFRFPGLYDSKMKEAIPRLVDATGTFSIGLLQSMRAATQ